MKRGNTSLSRAIEAPVKSPPRHVENTACCLGPGLMVDDILREYLLSRGSRRRFADRVIQPSSCGREKKVREKQGAFSLEGKRKVRVTEAVG